MAHTTSQMLIGKYMELLPHTGIVAFGKEYHFSKEDSSGTRDMFTNAARQFQQQGGGGIPAGVEARVHWQAQLGQMAAMGLIDEAMNIRALQQANGNVEVAVNNVFSMAGQ